ncbi:hypothetical protein A2U01_0018522, partial [Trifolium medium]|nr:hypothetical protein [Trifolium medium]
DDSDDQDEDSQDDMEEETAQQGHQENTLPRSTSSLGINGDMASMHSLMERICLQQRGEGISKSLSKICFRSRRFAHLHTA